VIISGECPPEVHILVDRYDIDDIPRDRATLELWLRESFYRKERILKAFYEGGSSDSDTEGKVYLKHTTDAWPQKVNLSGRFDPTLCVSAVLGWTIGVFFLMFELSWFRWIVVLYYLTCMVFSLRLGYGLDKAELSINGVAAPTLTGLKMETSNGSAGKKPATAVTATAADSKMKSTSNEASRLL
jgi:uncharacterized membrane protein